MYNIFILIIIYSVVVNLKWGYALSDQSSPLFVSFMICILLYFLGDEAIK